MNKTKLVVFGAICIFLAVAITSVVFGLSREEKEDTYRELELFADALAFVQTRYVEAKSAQDLIYGALEGMLASLDPYSQFLTPEDYKELLVETGGRFGGLGVEITIKDGLLTVVSPLEDTPAWKAGLKPGDRIVKIEGELTRGITLTDAVKKLRGDPKTDVTITILREKERKVFDVTITREIIKIKDIRRNLLLENNIGYIRLSEFREDTANELDKAITETKKQGAKAYILDLRNNPGGLLDSAVSVTSRFVDENKLIVYTLDKEGKKIEYKSSPRSARILQEPLVVIVNEGSASGSEIVAGCLKDYKRAVILGAKTFGKASVQTVLPLSDGSALRLTTAKYYTPKGKLIQDEGITPDIEVEQRELKTESSKEEEIFDKIEEKKEPEEDFYKVDYQIIRALDLVKGLLILSETE
ncbi:MAG: S41 family peptidase [Candidatus Omnitrophica bacterium]|nr:S41 family peptidase [Candidatus Omnitrophota bacterium]